MTELKAEMTIIHLFQASQMFLPSLFVFVKQNYLLKITFQCNYTANVITFLTVVVIQH